MLSKWRIWFYYLFLQNFASIETIIYLVRTFLEFMPTSAAASSATASLKLVGIKQGSRDVMVSKVILVSIELAHVFTMAIEAMYLCGQYWFLCFKKRKRQITCVQLHSQTFGKPVPDIWFNIKSWSEATITILRKTEFYPEALPKWSSQPKYFTPSPLLKLSQIKRAKKFLAALKMVSFLQLTSVKNTPFLVQLEKISALLFVWRF